MWDPLANLIVGFALDVLLAVGGFVSDEVKTYNAAQLERPCIASEYRSSETKRCEPVRTTASDAGAERKAPIWRETDWMRNECPRNLYRNTWTNRCDPLFSEDADLASFGYILRPAAEGLPAIAGPVTAPAPAARDCRQTVTFAELRACMGVSP